MSFSGNAVSLVAGPNMAEIVHTLAKAGLWQLHWGRWRNEAGEEFRLVIRPEELLKYSHGTKLYFCPGLSTRDLKRMRELAVTRGFEVGEFGGATQVSEISGG